ncbi:MAG: hypothetical protein IH951_11870 [Bacteroidetes bacterium]|nr:hypothetical protein [Bacteroidota bacterium]
MKRSILALCVSLLAGSAFAQSGVSNPRDPNHSVDASNLTNLNVIAGDGVGVSNGVFFIRIGNGIQFTNGVLTVTPGTGLSVSNGVLFATAVVGTNDLQAVADIGAQATNQFELGVGHVFSDTSRSSILSGNAAILTNADFSVIAGGDGNKIRSGDYNFIGGGQRNEIDTGGGRGWSSILGGFENKITSGDSSMISGGDGNEIIPGDGGVVLRGYMSAASVGSIIYSPSSSVAILAGGNTISNATESAILAGSANEILGDPNAGANQSRRNAILNGQNNIISNVSASVTASLIAGHDGILTNSFAVLFALNTGSLKSFSQGDNTFAVNAPGGIHLLSGTTFVENATSGKEALNWQTTTNLIFTLAPAQGLSNVLAVSNDAGGQSATNFGTNQMVAIQLGTNTPITGQVVRSFLTNGQANVDFTSPLTVDSNPVLTEASETNLIVFTWTSIGNLTGASSFDGLRVLSDDAEIISFWAVTDDAGTAGNTISVSLNFSDIAGSDNTIQTNGWTLAEVTDPTSRLDLQGNGQATARILYTNSLFSVTNFSLGDVFSVDIEDSGAQASDLIVQAVFRKN